MPTEKIYLTDHVEAAAFGVTLSGMGYSRYLGEIGSDGSGWYVAINGPLPPEIKDGVIRAIQMDQRRNPAKWTALRAESVQPPPHPNMIAVECETPEDILPVAESMRQASIADPDRIDAYVGSDTVTLARFNSAMTQEQQIKSNRLRFIFFDKKLITLCLSLKDDGKSKEWNFSTSMRTGPGQKDPQRVPDDTAAMLVKVMLGDGATEVEPKAAWKTIRHFVKEYKE